MDNSEFGRYDAEIVATHDNSNSLTPYFGAGKTLPTASRFVPPPVVPVTPDPVPELAATSTEVNTTLGVAAGFLALGLAGGYLHRRRVRSGQ